MKLSIASKLLFFIPYLQEQGCLFSFINVKFIFEEVPRKLRWSMAKIKSHHSFLWRSLSINSYFFSSFLFSHNKENLINNRMNTPTNIPISLTPIKYNSEDLFCQIWYHNKFAPQKFKPIERVRAEFMQ